MPELILHHYEASPFSEKVRLVLGRKRLAYRSVRIPVVMPKPDVLALTGGYRKTPLLQVANHVYCDTALIARVLERVQPEPTLYPDALAEITAEWADTALFDAAAAMSTRPTTLDRVMQLMTPDELMRFRDDRIAMVQGARRPFPAYATGRAHAALYLARLEGALSSRAYLGGQEPSIADFSAYHPVWFLDMLSPEILAKFSAVRTWQARMAAIGHGQASPLPSEDALAVCRSSDPNGEFDTPATELEGLPFGSHVMVRAADYGRDPVEGVLVHARPNEVVIQRDDERAGRVFVHFPRIGYDLRST